MKNRIFVLAICIMMVLSTGFSSVRGRVSAPTLDPGEPMVTGTPSLNASVVVFPYDVDLFGVYIWSKVTR